MQLKYSLILSLVTAALGAYSGFKLSPGSSAPPPPAIAQQQGQQQAQNCTAVVSRKTNPDGSIDELFKFIAANAQAAHQTQEVAPPAPAQSLNGLYAGGGADSELKGKFAAELIINDQSHEFISDGKNDHLYLFKYKVFSF